MDIYVQIQQIFEVTIRKTNYTKTVCIDINVNNITGTLAKSFEDSRPLGESKSGHEKPEGT